LNVIDFHIKYGCHIDVKSIKNGCLVYYPANLMTVPSSHENIAEYVVTQNTIKYKDFNGDVKEIGIDKYIQRLYITTDILLKMTIRNLNQKLIIVDGMPVAEKSIVQILPRPMRKEDVNLEEQLSKIYSEIVLGSSDETSANELGVLRGYKVLSDLVASGGIC